MLFMSLALTGTLVTPGLAEQTATGSSWLKAVGQAAVQAGVQALSPQAQAVVNDANKLKTPSEKENFIVAKAQTFMTQKNYDMALQLANYVVTNVNAKSLSAQKIVTDAKAALAKLAQDKLQQTQAQSTQSKQAQQVQADATNTVNGVKGLLGSFGSR